MQRPSNAIVGDSTTRVLMALIDWPLRYPPTVREIAERVGLGVSAVHHHLGVLRSEGLITGEVKQARTMRALVERVETR